MPHCASGRGGELGGIAAKVLGGARPAEFPIQRPVHFQFVINLPTARLLDLTIPTTLLALADEVVE